MASKLDVRGNFFHIGHKLIITLVDLFDFKQLAAVDVIHCELFRYTTNTPFDTGVHTQKEVNATLIDNILFQSFDNLLPDVGDQSADILLFPEDIATKHITPLCHFIMNAPRREILSVTDSSKRETNNLHQMGILD